MAKGDSIPSKYLDLLFCTGLALLLCHELDAVAQSEPFGESSKTHAARD